MLRRLRGDIAVQTSLWVTLAVAAFTLSFEFDETIQGYALGPANWPRALAVLLLLAALGLLIDDLRKNTTTAENEEAGALHDAETGSRTKLMALMGLPIAYVASMPWLGFYAVTPVFVALYMVAMGERRWLHVLLITAFIVAILYFTFVSIFFVPLPTGRLPGFYDFSNWLLGVAR